MSDEQKPVLRMTEQRAAVIKNLGLRWSKCRGDLLDSIDAQRPYGALSREAASRQLRALTKAGVLEQASRGYYQPGLQWDAAAVVAQSYWDTRVTDPVQREKRWGRR